MNFLDTAKSSSLVFFKFAAAGAVALSIVLPAQSAFAKKPSQIQQSLNASSLLSVPIRVDQTLTSEICLDKDKMDDETCDFVVPKFSVAVDVWSSKGEVIIAGGTPVEAEVSVQKRQRTLRKGLIKVDLIRTHTVEGIEVPLSAHFEVAGDKGGQGFAGRISSTDTPMRKSAISGAGKGMIAIASAGTPIATPLAAAGIAGLTGFYAKTQVWPTLVQLSKGHISGVLKLIPNQKTLLLGSAVVGASAVAGGLLYVFFKKGKEGLLAEGTIIQAMIPTPSAILDIKAKKSSSTKADSENDTEDQD